MKPKPLWLMATKVFFLAHPLCSSWVSSNTALASSLGIQADSGSNIAGILEGLSLAIKYSNPKVTFIVSAQTHWPELVTWSLPNTRPGCSSYMSPEDREGEGITEQHKMSEWTNACMQLEFPSETGGCGWAWERTDTYLKPAPRKGTGALWALMIHLKIVKMY